MLPLPQRNQPNWPQVVIAAEAEQEPFQDVTIVTAKGLFVNLALESAADLVYTEGHTLTTEKVRAIAIAMIAERKVMVQEHVRINSEGITVCLDVPNIDDETVQWIALDRLAKSLDHLDGCVGVVTFSGDLVFDIKDVVSLMP